MARGAEFRSRYLKARKAKRVTITPRPRPKIYHLHPHHR